MKVPLLPRNRLGRRFEVAGLRFREITRTPLEEPLDPFALAKHFKIQVIEPSHIRALTPEELHLLMGRYAPTWSGATLAFSDGWQLCILNPTHNAERTKATLMEEIAHVSLGHKPTKITTGLDGLCRRDYEQNNEKEAYAVGAAALVPYAGLFMCLMKGSTVHHIARRYGVSKQLVEYRIKITLLWRLYKQTSARGE
ncbi:MAG TPA: ImmA/IrrE family metallo-endopeptidase [Methylomirabilota bacterium]|nr:ImmA/IrrE family metallo-endopeptidase [Methylomirabilota bacterium]